MHCFALRFKSRVYALLHCQQPSIGNGYTSGVTLATFDRVEFCGRADGKGDFGVFPCDSENGSAASFCRYWEAAGWVTCLQETRLSIGNESD